MVKQYGGNDMGMPSGAPPGAQPGAMGGMGGEMGASGPSQMGGRRRRRHGGSRKGSKRRRGSRKGSKRQRKYSKRGGDGVIATAAVPFGILALQRYFKKSKTMKKGVHDMGTSFKRTFRRRR